MEKKIERKYIWAVKQPLKKKRVGMMIFLILILESRSLGRPKKLNWTFVIKQCGREKFFKIFCLLLYFFYRLWTGVKNILCITAFKIRYMLQTFMCCYVI